MSRVGVRVGFVRHRRPVLSRVAAAVAFVFVGVIAADEPRRDRDSVTPRVDPAAESTEDAPGSLDDAARPGGSVGTPRSTTDLWDRFLDSLRASGRGDLIDELSLSDRARLDFERGDLVRAVLARFTPELRKLHALFAGDREASSLTVEELDVAIAQARRLQEVENRFIRYYGDYYRASLELEMADRNSSADAGDRRTFARALLEALAVADDFLPVELAHRRLSELFVDLNETTLAILELQLFLVELPESRASERAEAETALARLREKPKHPGPVRETSRRMRTIAERLSDSDVGAETQREEAGVVAVLDRVARLLEKVDEAGGPRRACSGSACKRGKLAPGSKAAKGRGQGTANARGEITDHASGQAGGNALREEPERRDRERWGEVNEADVARSLREVWEKLPGRYRRVISDYFRDISGLADE